MRYTSARVKAEWQNPELNPLLKRIVSDVAGYALERWNWHFTATSIYRSPAEDAKLEASGVHAEWRAIDVRTRGRSAETIADVSRYANEKWLYDETRPHLKVCVTELHGTGPHAHFQVHPRTKLRKQALQPPALQRHA